MTMSASLGRANAMMSPVSRPGRAMLDQLVSAAGQFSEGECEAGGGGAPRWPGSRAIFRRCTRIPAAGPRRASSGIGIPIMAFGAARWDDREGLRRRSLPLGLRHRRLSGRLAARTPPRPGPPALLTHLVARDVGCCVGAPAGQEYAAQRIAQNSTGLRRRRLLCQGRARRAGFYVTSHLTSGVGPTVFVDDRPEDLSPGLTVIALALPGRQPPRTRPGGGDRPAGRDFPH